MKQISVSFLQPPCSTERVLEQLQCPCRIWIMKYSIRTVSSERVLTHLSALSFSLMATMLERASSRTENLKRAKARWRVEFDPIDIYGLERFVFLTAMRIRKRLRELFSKDTLRRSWLSRKSKFTRRRRARKRQVQKSFEHCSHVLVLAWRESPQRSFRTQLYVHCSNVLLDRCAVALVWCSHSFLRCS